MLSEEICRNLSLDVTGNYKKVFFKREVQGMLPKRELCKMDNYFISHSFYIVYT